MTIRSMIPRLALGLALAAGLAGCTSEPAPDVVAEPTAAPEAEPMVEPPAETMAEPTAESMMEPAEAVTETHAVHWTYEGEEGPESWGELSPEYERCGMGKAQSPIDIAGFAEQDLANIVFNYQPTKVNILNNGHTVQVEYDPGSSIELDDVVYDLKQFHFHAPSEHSIAGELAAAELHLVHAYTDADGKVNRAVVGVLVNEGAENPAFASVWANLSAATEKVHTVEGQAMAADMLPPAQTTYRYDGSLTTPPCSEDVEWNVMTMPIEMSAEQIAAYTALFEGKPTNRPVQPLGDRKLLQDTSP